MNLLTDPCMSVSAPVAFPVMFEMDPAATRAGLTEADASAASQLPATVAGLRVGSYTTPLLHAADMVHAVRDAQVQAHATANSVNREMSVAAVEATEAANSSALSC